MRKSVPPEIINKNNIKLNIEQTCRGWIVESTFLGSKTKRFEAHTHRHTYTLKHTLVLFTITILSKQAKKKTFSNHCSVNSNLWKSIHLSQTKKNYYYSTVCKLIIHIRQIF
uniref:(northern house mosquito) hypothetical protein n=1 Tax=Culex pipiens TaxID=7175 RepID=A0A8D8FA62_CULPI